MSELTRQQIALFAKQEMSKRPGGPTTLEQLLWQQAETASQGNRLITANLANDPYLLRTYLTPEREVLQELLEEKLGIRNKLIVKAATLARPYLHYFFRGDEDRAVHSHPWTKSVSLILSGGYTEHRWNFLERSFDTKWVGPGSVNFIARNDYHRVELSQAKGCWTLFLSMGRVADASARNDWNFLNTDTGVITPWGQWIDQREMPAGTTEQNIGDQIADSNF